MNRTLRFILIASVFMAVATIIQVEFFSKKEKATAITGSMAGVPIGGPFSLVDHNGVAVTEASYKGHFKLIYFGFTFCPAICPTELQKISEAYVSLPKEIQEQIQMLFITVDPERDTVKVMHEYVDLFHDDLVGLTGTTEQVQAAMDTYRIYAAKVEAEEMSDYTMDHSSYIYLMNPTDQLLSIYKIETSAQEIVNDLTKKIIN